MNCLNPDANLEQSLLKERARFARLTGYRIRNCRQGSFREMGRTDATDFFAFARSSLMPQRSDTTLSAED